MRLARISCLLGVAAVGGCADPEREPVEPVEPPSATSVRFALDDGVPLAFGDVPFPNDLYRDDDGRIALGAFPNPIADGPMFARLRAELATRSGFCASCAITFTIDGDLLAGTVPESAELGSIASLDDPIVLVDVDPDSPELGSVIPLRVQFEPAVGRIAVRPVRGAVLHGSRRYAAVLTTAVRGADDLPLAAAPEFIAARDGDASDAALERASAAIEPALATLEELGLDRERVAGLASFTTEDPSADARSIRATLHASAAPVAVVDRVWTGAAIDELLGTPATPGVGIDREPAQGTEGTSAISHETTAAIVTGWFAAPRFVEGSGIDVGALVRDDDGHPTATGTDDVPFVLVIPHDVDPTRMPVVISHHGFNASRTTGFALTDTAGNAGFAVLAIDAYQHGARASSADDRMHAMRGIEGPDGFAEASTLDVSLRVFGLAGVPSESKLYPGYPLAAFEQFAADVMSTVRFVREGDLAAIRAADPALAELAFDPDRIAYVGNSMGAVVGTAVVAAEPDVHAFVLDVMPGSIVETLAESGEFRPLMDTVLLPQLGVDGEFDEVDRELVFDPTVDLVRWALEPVDPLALAPYLVRSRSSPAPDLLVQLAGHDEVAAPTASESVVAAAGIPGHGEFAFAAVVSTKLPLSGDAVAPTIGASRFATAMHGMLEVSLQNSKWAEPLEPPLVARDATVVENPIAEVHGQIEVFLASWREDGRATIVP